ncbi:efflux RND transporter periplasmic adaptor subunit [Roseovarius tibetensis]|uniref:efflux RND transporter periplasmic adaptor subunit n=1 Tax=Roseovarius tibetensis TaxID=2685897 RepID=UPI003D7F75FA
MPAHPWRYLCVCLFVLLAGTAATGEPFAVEQRILPDRKAVFAQVESADITRARTRIAGTIEELSIDEGDAVEAGARIARVVDPKLPLEVTAIQNRIEAAQARVREARLERDRMEALRERGTVSQSTMDTAQTRFDVAKGELAALSAERKVVEQRRREGDVLAPATGRVLEVHVTDAQVVQPGELIATIACECYVLRLRLPERHARFIAEGDTVLVGERGLSIRDEALREGRVSQVYPRLENGRVVADVEVAGLGDYFVGERTRVFVATDQRPAFMVPPAYLRKRSGVNYVHVQGIGPVVVQPGRPLAEGVEILSGVLTGDVLLLPEEANKRAGAAK